MKPSVEKLESEDSESDDPEGLDASQVALGPGASTMHDHAEELNVEEDLWGYESSPYSSDDSSDEEGF